MKYLDSFPVFESKHRYSVGQIVSDATAQLIVDLIKDYLSLGINQSPDILYTMSGKSPITIEVDRYSGASLARLNRGFGNESKTKLQIQRDIIDPASPNRLSDSSLRGIIKHEIAHHWQNSEYVNNTDVLTNGKGKKFLINMMRKIYARQELIGNKSYSMSELELSANLAPFYSNFRGWIQDPYNRDLAKQSLRKGDINAIFLGDHGALENDSLMLDIFLFYFGEPGKILLGEIMSKREMESGDFKKHMPDLHKKVLRSFLITLSSILNGSEEEEEDQISISEYLAGLFRKKGLWDKYENKVSVREI